MWSQLGSLDEGADITAIRMLISKENNCKAFPPMPWVLRACISPALCNSHLFVLRQGRGAPSPPCRVPRAAPGTGSVPASHGERQGWGWGMLLQKSRLRRRALSQPPGPWPSVGGAPERGRLCSVVFGTGFTLRTPGMIHDGYKGDFSLKKTIPPPNNRRATLLDTLHGWLSVCLSWGGSSTAGLEWEGRAALSQSAAEACPPSVARSFPFSSFVSRLAPGWGRPEKFVQIFKIKDI